MLIWISLFGQLAADVEKTFTVEVEADYTLKEVLRLLAILRPSVAVKRVLFAGKQLKDGCSLASYGVYKECTIQVYVSNAHASQDLVPELPSSSPSLGDVLLINLVCCRNLVPADMNGLSDAYVVLANGQQSVRSSIVRKSLNPTWNETFGLHIAHDHGRAVDKTVSALVFDHEFITSDTQLGTLELRLNDIPYDRTVERFWPLSGVAHGEVQLCMRRSKLTSSKTLSALKRLIALSRSWKKSDLAGVGVSLSSFLGDDCAGWILGDVLREEAKFHCNPALDHLTKLLKSDSLRLENAETLQKIMSILHSQHVLSTPEPVSRVLWFSDIRLTESDFYYLLQDAALSANAPSKKHKTFLRFSHKVGKKLKYKEASQLKFVIYSNNRTPGSSPRHSPSNPPSPSSPLQRPGDAFAFVCFKTPQAALLSLLALLQDAAHRDCFQMGFGSNPSLDKDGKPPDVMRAGFLRVSTPDMRDRRREELEASCAGGEQLAYTQEEDEEWGVFWVAISADYKTISCHGKSTFTVAMDECVVMKSSACTLELVDRVSGSNYYIRPNSAHSMDAWLRCLRVARRRLLSEPDVLETAQLDEQFQQLRVSSSEGADSFPVKCNKCGKRKPLHTVYILDGSSKPQCRACLMTHIAKYATADLAKDYSVQDIKDLLDPAAFQRYLEDCLREYVEASPDKFVECPKCRVCMEFSVGSAKKDILDPQLMGLDNRPLSPAAQRHFLENRVHCRTHTCLVDFCRKCAATPYHTGMDCAEYQEFKDADHCRFCSAALTKNHRLRNPLAKALEKVCDSEECVEKASHACVKTLSCGHACFGIRDERTCPPCLLSSCSGHSPEIKSNAMDMCTICYTDELGQAPVVILECTHVFHLSCVQRRVDAKWPGARISFEFMHCSVCRNEISHPALDDVLAPHRKLRERVLYKGLMRLQHEELDKHPSIVDVNGEFHDDPMAFAAQHYSFFLCYQCKQPYFAGAAECGAADENEVDEKELICAGCQTVESLDECQVHGNDWLVFKCRYCCNVANYHCWGNVHFCDHCHKGGVWDKLSTYSTGKNKKRVEEYNQCPSIREQLQEILQDPTLSTRAQKEDAMSKVMSDPRQCPLHRRHPPNGYEFGLGCLMCADKGAEEDNRRAALVASKERSEEQAKLKEVLSGTKDGRLFQHQVDFDDKGIMYFLGSLDSSREWKNPGACGFVEVTASSLMSDSEPPFCAVGRSTVRCVTKPHMHSWFRIDLVDKWVTPHAYSLRHYSTWDSEALRSWVLEGSLDGETWLLLKNHTHDCSLSTKGATATWKVDYGRDCRLRYFRVRQTGVNSNSHQYLAMSGFELYGQLHKSFSKDAEKQLQKEVAQAKHRAKEEKRHFFEDMDRGVSYTLSYRSESDQQGVLYFIGTNGHTRPWVNPALQGLVKITSSNLVNNSKPCSAIAGRSLVRCVTKPEEGAWFQVDLLDKYLQPTHYTLRHYETWDTEALRNWVLEASNDGRKYDIVRSHTNDEGVKRRGQVVAWPLNCKRRYRMWRVRQTGLNSNNHKYLALSGIELYGRMFTMMKDAKAEAERQRRLIEKREKTENESRQLSKVLDDGPQRLFSYSYDLDQNGVCYYLGTNYLTEPWQNPASRGSVVVTSSALGSDSQSVVSVVGRSVVRCVTRPVENSWFAVDLVDKYVHATHYTLRHYSSWDVEALRNWVLEASVDNLQWDTLLVHENDPALSFRGATHTWSLPPSKRRYRVFRVRQTGRNSNGHWYLALSGFEVYGRLFLGASAVPAPPTPTPAITPTPGALQAPGATPGGPGAVPGASADMTMDYIRQVALQEKARLWKHLEAGHGYQFVPKEKFDQNGILFFLGSDSRTAPWQNPVHIGAVRVLSSALCPDSQPATSITGRTSVRCVTAPVDNSWFLVDLVDKYVQLSHYSLRHYSSWDTECLRNWVLEVSNDAVNWLVLREHVADTSLNGKGSVYAWPVQSNGRRYRMFRIRQTGLNSNQHKYLSLSGVELYGVLFRKPQPVAVNPNAMRYPAQQQQQQQQRHPGQQPMSFSFAPGAARPP